jgi:hypothetical protein
VRSGNQSDNRSEKHLPSREIGPLFLPIQFAQTQEFRAPLKKIESEQLMKSVPAFRVLRTGAEMLSKSFRAIQLCDFQQ